MFALTTPSVNRSKGAMSFRRVVSACQDALRHRPLKPVDTVPDFSPEPPIEFSEPVTPRGRQRAADAILRETVETHRVDGLLGSESVWRALTKEERTRVNRRLTMLGCPKLFRGADPEARFVDFLRDCCFGLPVNFPEIEVIPCPEPTPNLECAAAIVVNSPINSRTEPASIAPNDSATTTWSGWNNIAAGIDSATPNANPKSDGPTTTTDEPDRTITLEPCPLVLEPIHPREFAPIEIPASAPDEANVLTGTVPIFPQPAEVFEEPDDSPQARTAEGPTVLHDDMLHQPAHDTDLDPPAVAVRTRYHLDLPGLPSTPDHPVLTDPRARLRAKDILKRSRRLTTERELARSWNLPD